MESVSLPFLTNPFSSRHPDLLLLLPPVPSLPQGPRERPPSCPSHTSSERWARDLSEDHSRVSALTSPPVVDFPQQQGQLGKQKPDDATPLFKVLQWLPLPFGVKSELSPCFWLPLPLCTATGSLSRSRTHQRLLLLGFCTHWPLCLESSAHAFPSHRVGSRGGQRSAPQGPWLTPSARLPLSDNTPISLSSWN